MPNLVPIPDKAMKLIPRLASDHDGEVVATARALVRTLKGAGLTLHDLSEALNRPQSMPQQRQAETPSWRMMARFLNARSWMLSQKESAFVADMARKAQVPYGRGLSDKQMAWLEGLYLRVCDAGAHA